MRDKTISEATANDCYKKKEMATTSEHVVRTVSPEAIDYSREVQEILEVQEQDPEKGSYSKRGK